MKGKYNMKDYRFFKRNCFVIDFKNFEEVMQELLDDRTIHIDREFHELVIYSSGYDCDYEVEEINDRIANYLKVEVMYSFVDFYEETICFVLKEN